MKVSIIVPVYNVENYLEKCLNSLVSQTLKGIEIIVINDGSKDDSQKIIDVFSSKYPDKIKSYSKENGGLSDARNFGIDRAVGDFIAFVDSDDYVSEIMFEDMYGLAQKHNADIVVCNLQKVNDSGIVLQKLEQVGCFSESINLQSNFSVFSDISCFACNKLFKKDLFTKKRFKKGVCFEDIQLIPQLLLESKMLAFTPKFHYQYLERENSITKTHSIKGLDIISAVEDVESAFRNSVYKNKIKELQDFQILEGVYTFLAYIAFVKDKKAYCKMNEELSIFRKERNLTLSKILRYRRFGRNYILNLPLKKQIYYFLYFFKQHWLLNILIK